MSFCDNIHDQCFSATVILSSLAVGRSVQVFYESAPFPQLKQELGIMAYYVMSHFFPSFMFHMCLL